MPAVERIKGPADLLGSGDYTLEFMGDTFELEEEDGWYYPKGGSPRSCVVVPDPNDPGSVLVITIEPITGTLTRYGAPDWTLESVLNRMCYPLFDVKVHVLKVDLDVDSG